MKARLPQGYGSGGMNPNNMMKQVQKMQADMQAAQEALEQKEYTSAVGGGALCDNQNDGTQAGRPARFF